jgi:uncharacterized membrane protein YhaH (DUF805 family)
MNFNAVIENFKNVLTHHYFDFQGRARRSEFWWYILVVIVIQIILSIIQRFVGTQILTALLSLALLLPNLGISVRRLHDLEKSGWWILLPLAPMVLAILCMFMFQWTLSMIFGLVTLACSILLIYWYAMPGTAGTNKYGPDPKAAGKK